MRKWWVAFLAVALVLLAVLLTLVMPRHCPVNRAAFERIKEGMTQEEVHAILGGPPGDYRTRPPAPHLFLLNFRSGPLRLIEEWEGDEGSVIVDYCTALRGHETVMLPCFQEAAPYDPGLVELVRWRLERLKERWLP